MQWIVVFDTNILISALLSLRGSPFRCLALAKEGIVQSVICQEILHEFQEKLEVKFDYSPLHAHAAANEVRAFSQLAVITNTLEVINTNHDDDKVLECAVVGGATHIVTGDRRHLLPLGSYQDFPIVTAADFLTLVLYSDLT